MKTKDLLVNMLIALVIVLCIYCAFAFSADFAKPLIAAPKPPASAYEYSIFRTGPYEVAKVLGRSSGCQDATPEFIESVSALSLKAGLDPRIAAATIAVESNCNQFAVSPKGALGMMQVMVLWRDKYDIGGSLNLLNTRDNISVGTRIEASLIQDYGVDEGLRRYNGLGVGGDPAYVSKILSLSGRK